MQSEDYARYAREVGQIGLAITPADTDPIAQTAKLAMFHLRTAARLLSEAECWMAKIEGKRPELEKTP